jgi:predicted permease
VRFRKESREAWIVKIVWIAFQTLGFAGLIERDQGNAGTTWKVLTILGFVVALPAMGVWIAMTWTERRPRP